MITIQLLASKVTVITERLVITVQIEVSLKSIRNPRSCSKMITQSLRMVNVALRVMERMIVKRSHLLVLHIQVELLKDQQKVKNL